MPKVSICCIGYNHEKYCEECIKSIWDQDYKNIEIIAIEDGSTDKTHEILCNLAQVSPCPMKVVTQNNTYNIGFNLNRTLKEATGEYIMIISLDDFYYPNVFKKLVGEIEKDKKVQFVSAKQSDEAMYNFNGLKYNFNKITAKEILKLEFETATGFWIQSTIFRKSIINTVGNFDEDLIGDDIVLRVKVLQYIAANSEITFKFINENIFFHRIHDSNISHNSERQCTIIYEVWKRYFPEYKESKLLDSWIRNVIFQHIFEHRFSDALRLIFSEKMNEKKIKNFLFLIALLPKKLYRFYLRIRSTTQFN